MSTSGAAADHSEPVDRFLATHADELRDQLASWVAIPSIAGDPDRTADVQRSAQWIASELRTLGATTQLVPMKEGVAVIGELRAADDRPTVLVYSHHDVRRADPANWEVTDPFVACERDGRLYGRGASDAKGQVIAHLWGLRAHLAVRQGARPAVNLVFLIDGSEERGSPGFAELIEQHADALACDLIVFSDTVQWRSGEPVVVTSMRGTITASLLVEGPHRDVHSGLVSGTAPNPAHMLAEIVAALHDDDGRVAVPGFYDGVEPLSDERRRVFAELSGTEDSWARRTETRTTTGERGYTALERLWARPSLEVLSLAAGDTGSVTRSVILAVATASISIRTVPQQDMHAVAVRLRRFVAEHMPPTVEYELTVDEYLAQPAYVTPEGTALRGLEQATARAHGTTSVNRMGNAGGGPADVLSRALRADVLFLGTGLPEDHWHADDESVDLATLRRGAATIAHLWDELAAGGIRGGDERR
ncbi:M20/M25/M40 family metallo-hydrolase [Microbacterium sp. M3]|uniref:M20/M25/M40 family metallo-hydrolase n=1 Tax=Microbacterium arthrosphaerae TaxID=792652 RepID=A0ABU4H0X7_9MICO|nr:MULTISPECIES: M20/M25/M40 family metallo-hydrolase [Microbacterium]MDW4572964.1 M20/M25/M40 family metallo-hydrolase [Microbacterium arthrosphaerae]MDW7606819.1 M20/M25/M40 family metallo-hydrolase [Microbacterium sp. M3]